jgi:hypothetical protein
MAVAAAIVVGAVAYFAGLYRATSGCEDAGIGCREAQPMQAISEWALAGVAVVALLVLARNIIRNTGRAQSAHRPLTVALVATGLWAALTFSGLEFGF